MSDTALTRETLEKLCRDQPLAVLATTGPTGPHTSLVAVAVRTGLRCLYFATPRNTRKWGNLKASPKVSLLVDNRSNQVSDFSQAVAATIIGTAQELAGADCRAALQFYLEIHPHLREFVASPDCALFQVTIEHISLVGNFQQVVRFDCTTGD